MVNQFLLVAKPAELFSRSAAALPSSPRKNDFNCRQAILLALLLPGTTFVSLAGCSAHGPVPQNQVAQNPATQSPQLPTEQASSAESLVDTAGICTHLTYTDSAYFTNWPLVFSSLKQLGVKHIRDGYTDLPADSPVFAEHQQLAQAGITTDYVVPFDPSITVQTLQQFAAKVGDVEDLEAPNECDTLANCGGGGNSGIANVVSFLPFLKTAANAVSMPLMGPSYVLASSYLTTGDIASLVNLNSMHIYFGGRNPGTSGWGDSDSQGNGYGSFAYWLDQSAIDAPGITPTLTETGYISSPSTSTPFTVPESVQASYILRTLLLSYKDGFQQTFFYQLLDEPSSPPGYGLLRSDMSQKPAFAALAGLLNLLNDSGGKFTAGSLPYTVTGADSNLNHLLLEKSDGSYWVVLWLEEPSWNPVQAVPLTVSPENIKLNFGNGYSATTDYQFDTNGNVTSFNQPMNGSSTSLTVTDQISVVKIVPQ